jgi:ABC-type transport system involved in multi-copper enzyme maturation permease subunit
MIPHNVWSVFRFEVRRTLTFSRIGTWLLLVLFPVFIISVMKYYEDSIDDEQFGRRDERPIEIAHAGVTVEIAWRDGRRVLTARYGSGPEERVVTGIIPNDLSRQEIATSYRDIINRLEADTDVEEQPRNEGVDDTVWGLVLLGLIPSVTTLLGLLLWATPLVQAELEGRTWIYVAVRPRGRVSVLFGKYLTAVAWTALAGWISCSICILIAEPYYALRLWATLMLIIGLACIGYGALYALIGVAIQRRAMVIAVAYTLIFEFLISFVPAVINQFTIQFRLRNLLVLLMGWRDLFPEDVGGAFLGDQPAWLHFVLLGTLILVLLVVASQLIQRLEYVTADEA